MEIKIGSKYKIEVRCVDSYSSFFWTAVCTINNLSHLSTGKTEEEVMGNVFRWITENNND